LAFGAMLYSFLRDSPTVQMLAEELIAISVKYDFPFFTPEGQLLRGWALAQQGAVQEGLTLLRECIEDQRRRGIRMFEPYYRSLLAETLALADEWEEALDEVTEALAYAEECGNCFWNAHLLKLQGDYMQALSLPAQEVEACYQRAIATARRQAAKSLELRATTSLCRLWQQQGKQVEARQELMAIYGWFTEGFDTVDLQNAKALLDEL
jgi:predicted ATPase